MHNLKSDFNDWTIHNNEHINHQAALKVVFKMTVSSRVYKNEAKNPVITKFIHQQRRVEKIHFYLQFFRFFL